MTPEALHKQLRAWADGVHDDALRVVLIEADARLAGLEALLRRAGCLDCVDDDGGGFPHAFDHDRKAALNSPDTASEGSK